MRAGFLLLVCVSFLLSGCDRFGAADEALGFGRIVLGESVDGVPLGADTTEVFARLGQPTEVRRGSGFVRYLYETGRYAGIEFYYDMRSDGSLSERSAIHLTAPYSGRTEDGIGIGSLRGAVISSLGDPPTSTPLEDDGVQDRYTSPEGNHLIFQYQGDRLIALGMAGRSE